MSRVARCATHEALDIDSPAAILAFNEMAVGQAPSAELISAERPPIWVPSEASAAIAPSRISGLGSATCSETGSTCAATGSVAGANDGQWTAFSANCDNRIVS